MYKDKVIDLYHGDSFAERFPFFKVFSICIPLPIYRAVINFKDFDGSGSKCLIDKNVSISGDGQRHIFCD